MATNNEIQSRGFLGRMLIFSWCRLQRIIYLHLADGVVDTSLLRRNSVSKVTRETFCPDNCTAYYLQDMRALFQKAACSESVGRGVDWPAALKLIGLKHLGITAYRYYSPIYSASAVM